jgi:hypothetical protein
MVCTTFVDKVSLKWCNGKYKRIIPLGRNNLSKLRTNPVNNSLNSTATNQWSKQVIKAYKKFIPAEHELHEKRQHISIPSAMNEEIEEQPQLNRCDLEEELLLWHQRFTQMPFEILQHMSKIGSLTKRLSSIQQAKCHACMLGKATKVPWRVKKQDSHIINATKPGKRVSVDQLGFFHNRPDCSIERQYT